MADMLCLVAVQGMGDNCGDMVLGVDCMHRVHLRASVDVLLVSLEMTQCERSIEKVKCLSSNR